MIGNIAGVKTTGERIFVLRESKDGEIVERPSLKAYVCRRPCVGQNGLFHNVDIFYSDEIESIEDSLRRELNEMVLKAKLQNEILKKARQEDEALEASPIKPDITLN